MTHELYKKHRPDKLSEVRGQSQVTKPLSAKLKNGEVPHCCLFEGPSGCGKTTIARILADRLGCASDFDLVEINAADKNGIDDIRNINQRMGLAPGRGSKCRVWIIDECHELSKNAQNAVLKMLEDTPKHVYFLLCTTDPGKLLKTILNRCTRFKLGLLSQKELEELLTEVVNEETIETVSSELIEEIARAADGSARQALVLLDQVKDFEDEEEQLSAITFRKDHPAFEIARQLIFEKKPSWSKLSKLLTEIKEVKNDPEGLRWMVLTTATNTLTGNKTMFHKRAFRVIEVFRDNFYDSKHAGFVSACYEVVSD